MNHAGEGPQSRPGRMNAAAELLDSHDVPNRAFGIIAVDSGVNFPFTEEFGRPPCRRACSRGFILPTVIGKATPEKNPAAVVEHYAKLAPKYDERWDHYTQRTLSAAIAQIDAALPADRGEGGRVLDVACGTGRLEEMLLRRRPGVHIMGVDLSPDMIEVARQRVDANGQVEWRVASADDIPVEDASFDVVTCNNAFHLIPDQHAALREFRRVLRPGGRLVMVDWCREFPTIAGVLILSRAFGRQYRRIETIDGFSRLLEAAGFRVIHREKFHATWFWGVMCVAAEPCSA
jgi:ubiquinone/menaquinone biosynthesis C-methylase UbiE